MIFAAQYCCMLKRSFTSYGLLPHPSPQSYKKQGDAAYLLVLTGKLIKQLQDGNLTLKMLDLLT